MDPGGEPTPHAPAVPAVPPTATGILFQTHLTLRWVERDKVDSLLEASDTFEVLFAVDLAAGSAAFGSLLALTGTVVHPLRIYILLSVALTAGLICSYFTRREWRKRNTVRGTIDSLTKEVQVPFNLVAPGSPQAVTYGGLQA